LSVLCWPTAQLGGVSQDQHLRFVRQQGEAFLLISAFMLANAALLTMAMATMVKPIQFVLCSERQKKCRLGKYDIEVTVKGA